MERRLTFEIHGALVARAGRHLVVYLPHAAVPDAHHADIDLDGHAVRGEGDQAGREAQFEVEAPLERALDRRIGRELALRAAEEQLDVGEDAEALRLAEGDVAAVDRSERIGVAQRVVIVDAQVCRRVAVAEADVRPVEFEQRAAVDEAHAERRVVAQRVADHRTDLEGVAFGGDVVDYEHVVVAVVVGRIGDRTAEDPLSLGDEEAGPRADAALGAPLVDGFRRLRLFPVRDRRESGCTVAGRRRGSRPVGCLRYRSDVGRGKGFGGERRLRVGDVGRFRCHRIGCGGRSVDGRFRPRGGGRDGRPQQQNQCQKFEFAHFEVR